MARNHRRTAVEEAAASFCRVSRHHGGTLAERWSEKQEETGPDQKVQGKQLEGSLHGICATVPAAHLYTY